MNEVEQSKPRVSADEARELARRADDALARGDWMEDWENHAEIISDLAHTVTTEPERTRAAVVEALREFGYDDDLIIPPPDMSKPATFTISARDLGPVDE